MRITGPARALAILAGLAASGCAPKYYAPNTHNVPVLTRAGDYSGAFAFGDSRGELQAAYAVSERVALMLNAAVFDQADDADGDGGRGGILELGAGYLAPVGDRVQVGVFGLLGGGDLENHFPSTVTSNPGTTGTLEAHLARFGLQPTLSYRTTHFEAAASARVLGLRYSDVTGSLVFGGEDQVQMLRDQPDHTLLEPALTLRAGFETVKAQLQLGWSFNRGHSEFRQDEGHLTAGIVYSPR
ncbi:MAG: hypothetical protein AB7T31_13960 [Gemmatimonadales bacterium]